VLHLLEQLLADLFLFFLRALDGVVVAEIQPGQFLQRRGRQLFNFFVFMLFSSRW
jgi:hypothetical protein